MTFPKWLGFALSLLAAVPAWTTSSAYAASPWVGKTVQSIDVKGLKRIEKDAIIAKLSAKVGQTLTEESARADIQALYGLGYFDEIDLQGDAAGSGVALTVVVKERPVVAKVEFQGNERVSTSDLEEVIKVKSWTILDIAKVREDIALVQKHYEDKGFYLAKIDHEIKPVEGKKDEIELIYRVSDYEKVAVKKITFLNNKKFSDEQLKDILAETKEGGMLSFITGSGSFKEASFKNDLQRLVYWYLDHGYVRFRFENPVVTVSEDKKNIFITIFVDEGEQYSMGKVDFSGDLLFSKEELHSEVTLRSGQTFAITKRSADIQRLSEKYQDLGYAFTNVVPKMNVNDDEKIVDMDYSFEKGSLVYLGEIRILGNTKTFDKVVRRELKVVEGELYSGTRLRESKENVERLGYFAPGELIFNQVSPPGRQDVVDLEITVKERSTGTITLGAGFGSLNGFFFTTQISEINLFGRGQTLSLMAQLSVGSKDKAASKNKSFNLSFTDPYAFDTRWSLGGDLFYMVQAIPGKYDTRKMGTNARVGRPVFEYANTFVTYKLERLAVDNPDPTRDPLDVAADDGVLSSLVFSFLRDKRNNRFETSGGNYQSFSMEFAGIGGDKKFVKWVANNRYYKRLIGDFVFRNSIEIGQIYGLAGVRTPPSERFFLGGPNNMRGFAPFSLGPTRVAGLTAAGEQVIEPLGSGLEMFGLFEIEHPIVKEAGIKGVVFFDVGNGFAGWPGSAFELRTCAGLGVRWFSPIGPLRFEWGFPLSLKPNEDKYQFQFFIGPPF